SEKAYAASPDLFMRPGTEGFFTPQKWFSYIILWSFVNPLFPQLFSRFYTARSLRSLKVSTWLYPLLVSFLFLAPVLIGVWANGTSLDPGRADMILPAMVARFAPGWVHALVMTGALAALMSTADSQLLALSTMLARDTGIKRNQVTWGRLLTLGLCILVVVLILTGFDKRMDFFTLLTKTSFAGLIVLTPATVAALYFRKVPGWAVVASIIAGEGAVVAIWFGWLPTFGLVAGIVALIVAVTILALAYLVDYFFVRKKSHS
ncbi:sodium:solute symporter family protein, partial [candidate division WOR-3 bacterium]|nr:sodium:solute symporter family protein [candidate division WOR-3 bacterium]MBD3364686.1 sodium:solute symporter family protein [candidate division WOR-3 bacterium]